MCVCVCVCVCAVNRLHDWSLLGAESGVELEMGLESTSTTEDSEFSVTAD